MRSFQLILMGLLVGFALSGPADAEYRLNCRLMDRHHPSFERWCLGERDRSLRPPVQCSSAERCKSRMQNFKSAYAGSRGQSPDQSRLGTSSVSAGPVSGTLSGVGAAAGSVTSAARGAVGGALSATGL